MSVAERELRARPIADALYHVLAASLLLAEGQTLRDRSDDCRKFLLGALYVRRWMRAPAAGEPVFATQHLDWLNAIVDWTPIPADALGAVA